MSSQLELQKNLRPGLPVVEVARPGLPSFRPPVVEVARPVDVFRPRFEQPYYGHVYVNKPAAILVIIILVLIIVIFLIAKFSTPAEGLNNCNLYKPLFNSDRPIDTFPNAGTLGNMFISKFTEVAGPDPWQEDLCIGDAMDAYDRAIQDVYSRDGQPQTLDDFKDRLTSIKVMGLAYLMQSGGDFCENTPAPEYAREALRQIYSIVSSS